MCLHLVTAKESDGEANYKNKYEDCNISRQDILALFVLNKDGEEMIFCDKGNKGRPLQDNIHFETKLIVVNMFLLKGEIHIRWWRICTFISNTRDHTVVPDRNKGIHQL